MKNKGDIWVKPIICMLSTTLTLDPGQPCLAQNPNKIGGTVDGLTSNDVNPCAS